MASSRNEKRQECDRTARIESLKRATHLRHEQRAAVVAHAAQNLQDGVDERDVDDGFRELNVPEITCFRHHSRTTVRAQLESALPGHSKRSSKHVLHFQSRSVVPSRRSSSRPLSVDRSRRSSGSALRRPTSPSANRKKLQSLQLSKRSASSRSLPG